MDITRGLLIYDGDCGFCRLSLAWLLDHQRDDSRLSAVSSQELSDEELASMSLTRCDVQEFVWWVDSQRAQRGSSAVARALLQVNGAWPLLGSALLVPPLCWTAPLAYRWVARHRHWLPGATTHCERGTASPVTRRR